MNYLVYLLFLANLVAAYLYGHKRGHREGIAVGKSLVSSSPSMRPLRQGESILPPPSLDPSDLLPQAGQVASLSEVDDPVMVLGGYSVLRSGMILRGRVELAVINGDSPFEFERLPDVPELKSDEDHCRKLCRLWFESFGVDDGNALTLDGYWVSRGGLFWKGDLILGRVEGGGYHQFNCVNQYYGKPTPEDIEKCKKLYDLWLTELISDRS
jgi:hypothetical protein